MESVRPAREHADRPASQAVMGRAPVGSLWIGTRQSVCPWSAAMGAMAVNVVGCVLPADELHDASNASPGLPMVLGSWDELEAVLSRQSFETIFVSLPASMTAEARMLARELDRLGAPWRLLPSLADQLAGSIQWNAGQLPASPGIPGAPGIPGVSSASTLAVLDPGRLIARQPRALDQGAIRQTLQGKRVLITGSGGSIGSEIARLVAAYEPSHLILAERSENALFDIDRQIARLAPGVLRTAALHDITNASRTMALLRTHRPQVIFHAAAHKHVPMMEDHPADAVENNFYGTRNMAIAADAAGVEKFVMISSDKAVNPSSVMGATKRLAELFIEHLNTKSSTHFSMVRFGNVLGSACSVIPIWTQQLSHGGPITVTSADMVRYFMTIPEAAGLVLQSAAMSGAASLAGDSIHAKPAGEVFLLDMGKPVRIVDLAKRFIQAQGLEPGVDIQIQFTGVRPGEKLYEELAYQGEDMLPTAHPSVHLWRSVHPPDDARMHQIVTLMDSLRCHGADEHPWQHATAGAIHQALRQAVPEFKSPNPPVEARPPLAISAD